MASLYQNMKKLNIPLAALLSLSALSLNAQKVGDSLSLSGKLLLEGIQLHNDEKYTEALAKYSQVDVCDTNYTTIRYEQILTNFKAGNYDVAIRQGLDLIKSKDENYQATLLLLANCYNKKKQNDSCLMMLKRGYNEFPYSPKVSREYSLTAMEMKQWPLAMEHLKLSLIQDPLSAQVHLRIANLAYASGEPVIALMAFHFATLLNSQTNFQYEVYKQLQQVADDGFEPSFTPPDKFFGEIPELVDVNQLIKAKVPLSPKYKVKTRLDEHYIRQLQFALETIKEYPSKETNLIANYYLEFYTTVWKKDLFEAAIMTGLSGLKEVKTVAKAYKKSESEIKDFLKWATDWVIDRRKNKNVKIGENDVDTRYYYHPNGEVSGMGAELENGDNTGEWKYFSTTGYLASKGEFNDKGERTGKWEYYTSDGKVRKIVEYSNNGKSSSYEDFWSNGNLKQIGSYENNELNGLYKEFYPNGRIQLEVNLTAGRISSPLKTYYDNGQLKIEKEWVNGGFNGYYREYHNNGILKLETTINNDNFSGLIKMYYPNGQLEEECNFTMNQRDGMSTSYYMNGKISEKGLYKNGKKDGSFTMYHPSGKIREERTYKNGKDNGPSVWYDTDEKVYARLQFKNERLAEYSFFDKNNKVVYTAQESGSSIKWVNHTPWGLKLEESTYEKGNFDGAFTKYHLDGSKRATMNYNEGLLDGEIKHYYPNGQVQHELLTKKDNKEGFCRSFHANGLKSLEGYYLSGDKVGRWNYFDVQGKLYLSKFYSSGDPFGWEDRFYPNGLYQYRTHYINGLENQIIHYNAKGEPADTLSIYLPQLEYTLEPNGYIQEKGTYKYGKKDGTFEYYYGKNIKKKTVNFKNDLEEGITTQYFPNQKVRAIEKYKEGMLDSVRTYYNELGNVILRESYKLNEKEGTTFDYYYNGKVQNETLYENDESLSSKHYSIDGKLMFELKLYSASIMVCSYTNKAGVLTNDTIKNGKLNIEGYYPNGKLAVKFQFSNKGYTGEYKEYFPDGKLYYEVTYENELRNGIEKTYYPNGNLMRERNFKHDEYQGAYKYYFENGKLFIDEMFENDFRHGPATYYDANGQIKRKVNYHYGVEL